MNTAIILSYLLIFGGIVIWCLLLPSGKKVPHSIVEGITTFGGAFLLASCFINLVPHMYASGFYTPDTHIKLGMAVLIGFIIQMLLEWLTSGVEHGHNHCQECHDDDATEDHHSEHQQHHFHPITGLLVGLSIHAFLEGMPLVDSDGQLHQSLLYGIVLHNIPLALVLITLFIHNGFSTAKSIALLSLFAIMTPLGSLCNLLLLPPNETLQSFIMGIVIGILLHVSVSILFDRETNNKWLKLLLIVAAFAAAYLTPGCPEIYPG